MRSERARKKNDSWCGCSAEGFGDSGASSSFPQWSVRLSPTNTKNCVLDQGIAYYRGRERGRERERQLKRREGRDWGQREGQERMSASSASSVHLRSLHPSLHPHPPSCPSPSSPAAGQFLPQQRKTSLMAQTKTSVCLRTKNRVSL